MIEIESEFWRKLQLTPSNNTGLKKMKITGDCERVLKGRSKQSPTTMRFHIRAASATNVETPLQPGIRTILMGSVYRRSYSSLVASPGSHCKDKMTKC